MTIDAHKEQLQKKHTLLDKKIAEEMARPNADDLLISEMKKKKMHIKDEIERINHGDN